MSDLVEVTIGEHVIVMTAEEAAALTPERAAELEAEAIAAERSYRERLRQEAEQRDRVLAAASEGGPVVARVFCGRCRDAGPVAVVVDTTLGLIYDAVMPGSTHMPDEIHYRIKAEARAAGFRLPHTAAGVRYTAAGRCTYLLSDPSAELSAECPRPGHGIATIDRLELVQAIATRRGRVARVLIHRPPPPPRYGSS